MEYRREKLIRILEKGKYLVTHAEQMEYLNRFLVANYTTVEDLTNKELDEVYKMLEENGLKNFMHNMA